LHINSSTRLEAGLQLYNNLRLGVTVCTFKFEGHAHTCSSVKMEQICCEVAVCSKIQNVHKATWLQNSLIWPLV
jgi:hypothetical protein